MPFSSVNKVRMLGMASETAFVGDIPRIYDSHMAPFFFEFYAQDLATRLAKLNPKSVLKLACGTGVDARATKNALPEARLVATDLNPDMLKVASQKFAPGEVEFQPADAQALPFPDASFEAVSCQFGLMFVPDKDAAIREAYRVLTPGGTLICSVWDDLKSNPASEIAHQLVLDTCKTNPPMFWLTPFGYNDRVELCALFERNGFEEVSVEVITTEVPVPDANRMAHGLTFGTPMFGQLKDRPEVNLEGFEKELARRIEGTLNANGTSTIQALVVTGRKP